MMVQDVPLAYTVTRRNPRPGYWSNADKPLLSDTIQLDTNGIFHTLILKARRRQTSMGVWRLSCGGF